MENQFKVYLFDRFYLVHENDATTEESAATMISMAKLFNIEIVKGKELLDPSMISLVSEILGVNVPEPFYRGFPESVKHLTPQELLADQLLNYFITYGLNCFDEPRHSVMEETFERTFFNYEKPIRKFTVLTEKEAEEKLTEMVGELFMSSRPLGTYLFGLVEKFCTVYSFFPEKYGSKNTAVRLLYETRDIRFAKPLMMSDVIKLVEEIDYHRFYIYGGNMHKLKINNQDRKLVTAVMNMLFMEGRCDIRQCCEKKAVWNGLLHHIHYKPINAKAVEFVNVMRGRKNLSVMSEFEAAMNRKDVLNAARILKKNKGNGALLRNIDYILSRSDYPPDPELYQVLSDTNNVLILIQLLFHYCGKQNHAQRVFCFTRNETMVVHRETIEEASVRKTGEINEALKEEMKQQIRNRLAFLLKGRLGKVYIDPDMKNYAIPLKINAEQGGFGTLACGSRIPIPAEGMILRAFTYWEKVDDIDLSVIGLREDGTTQEFSWRTNHTFQNLGIIFSGDQTSGYHGGSEYFDIDPEVFKAIYPDIRYLIFCDNVYSGSPFVNCVCRAGYMLRDERDMGEVFDARTVRTAFQINCASTFAALYALDLESMELIWLNIALESSQKIAGCMNLDSLEEQMDVTKTYNLLDFMKMCAAEIVDDPMEAETVVSNETFDLPEGVEQISSVDTERILALMNM